MEKRNLFLQRTRYLDCNHPEIKKIAYKITNPITSEREKAEALFYWVKEKIRFEFGYWGIKASEVLKRKRGMCTNKVNLLIALLRAIKIPAGYGILRVDTKKFYRELMCPIFKKLVSPNTVHIYAGIFLNGKWIICDPSMDSELAKALKRKTPFAEMSGFNINKKEMKRIKGILRREEFIANIDKNLDKPSRHAKGITLRILNSYLRFLREKKQAIRILTEKQIEKKFLNWLSKRNLSYFVFLKKISSKSQYMSQLENKKILITAGPTWVPIDKVRVITNIFKGTLGLLIAKEAIRLGAKVTLLLGPGALSLPQRWPRNLRVIRFKFFTELYQLMRDEISSRKYDVVIHSAAVADYAPIKFYKEKIKSGKKNLIIRLKPTIKIVDKIKQWDPKIFLVKFKVEVNLNEKKLIERAYKNMKSSKAELIVANDLRYMKNKTHKAFIIDRKKEIVACNTKKEISKRLLKIISNKI